MSNARNQCIQTAVRRNRGRQFNHYAILFGGIALGMILFPACDPDWDTYDPLKGPISGQTTLSTSSSSGSDGGSGAGGNSMVCTPGSAIYCYSGLITTLNIGACKAGTVKCNADGSGYGACTGEVLPIPEDCITNAVDDNCDGTVNEGCPP